MILGMVCFSLTHGHIADTAQVGVQGFNRNTRWITAILMQLCSLQCYVDEHSGLDWEWILLIWKGLVVLKNKGDCAGLVLE